MTCTTQEASNSPLRDLWDQKPTKQPLQLPEPRELQHQREMHKPLYSYVFYSLHRPNYEYKRHIKIIHIPEMNSQWVHETTIHEKKEHIQFHRADKPRLKKVPDFKDFGTTKIPSRFKSLHGEKWPRPNGGASLDRWKVDVLWGETKEEDRLKMVNFELADDVDKHGHEGGADNDPAMTLSAVIPRFLRGFESWIPFFSPKIILSKIQYHIGISSMEVGVRLHNRVEAFDPS